MQQNALKWKHNILQRLVEDTGAEPPATGRPAVADMSHRPDVLKFRAVLTTGQARELQEFACSFSGLKGWSSLLPGRKPGSGVGDKDQHWIWASFACWTIWIHHLVVIINLHENCFQKSSTPLAVGQIAHPAKATSTQNPRMWPSWKQGLCRCDGVKDVSMRRSWSRGWERISAAWSHQGWEFVTAAQGSDIPTFAPKLSWLLVKKITW